MAGGQGPRGAVGMMLAPRMLAHVEGVPLLRRLVAPGVGRLAADSLMGEVAVPVDAAEALGLSPWVAMVRTPRAAGPALAMGALVGLVEEEGGDVERTSAGAALKELRTAVESGLSVVVWAVGPPYVAAVTADRPVFPAGLELNGRPGAPVRPGPRRPHVDKRLCNLCGECVRGCPTNRHVIARGEAQLKPFCSGCGVCESVCPQAAIQMVLPWRAVDGQG